MTAGKKAQWGKPVSDIMYQQMKLLMDNLSQDDFLYHVMTSIGYDGAEEVIHNLAGDVGISSRVRDQIDELDAEEVSYQEAQSAESEIDHVYDTMRDGSTLPEFKK